MRILIDTNVFLVCVSERSEHHWLYQAFVDEIFDLAVTTEILTEYEEQFTNNWGSSAAAEILNLIINVPNSIFVDVYFFFNLIKDDPDDNKFADCAVASRAACIVTFDKHFNVLKTVSFPKINVVHPDEFKQILTERNLLNK
jgi:uncharacterized protein